MKRPSGKKDQLLKMPLKVKRPFGKKTFGKRLLAKKAIPKKGV